MRVGRIAPPRFAGGKRLSRIIYVEPLGSAGGMGGYNHALVSALVPLVESIEVYSADTSRLPPGVEFRLAFVAALNRSRPRWTRFIAYSIAALGIVAKVRKGDVVVWHFPHAPLVDWVCLALLRGIGRTVIMIAHDPAPVIKVPMAWAYNRALGASTALIAHGEFAASTLKNVVGVEKILLSSHGDFEPRSAMARVRAEKVLGTNLAPHDPVVSIIGNLKPGKGTDRVIACLPLLRAGGIQLLLVGSPVGNAGLERRLAHFGQSAGVHKAFRRLTIDEEEAAYSASDVVLAVYESGFSSGVIATAHAFGKPVVLTDVGDLKRQALPGDFVLRPEWTNSELLGAIQVVLSRPRCPDSERLESGDKWLAPWRQLAGLISDAV